MYQSHLTDSYNLKEKKSISLSLSEKEPSHRERSKRTEPRRNSYNSENINRNKHIEYNIQILDKNKTHSFVKIKLQVDDILFTLILLNN